MEKVNIKELGNGYMVFGNLGNVWSGTAHVYKSGVGNICGTPALSSNHAKYNNIEEVGCPECLAKLAEEAEQ
jgi:hypothetical protein